MDAGCTLDSRLDYRFMQWALTSALHAVCMIAELPVQVNFLTQKYENSSQGQRPMSNVIII